MIKRIIPLILGLVLIITGIVFMTVLLKMADNKKARCSADTVGKVIDCFEQHDDDGTSYDITISFEIDGKSYTHITNQNERKDIGYEYSVHYNPDDPDEYIIDGVSATAKTLLISGLAILIAGLALFVYQLFRLMRGR